ncbi:hypothetical protein [Aminobacter ciceronei]|uniref:Uncharacterized protein n=1 Tax=Aminobacter ciceronei TaxID=150723 RepID=A0ABR6C7P8_9HYPH|nr:hypothetical protein [Aminobacter ciceronei]MBA8906816.1 hypothetical protein [Aminobacter ciceronei]MBA9020595.1 hypothetical protein [Aminobacter ciceronei]
MMDLAHHPVFEGQPSDDYLERWRQHTATTGRPEDFECVSTSRPTQHDNIVLLSEEITVPVLLRPGGERVPCSFCAPGSPKFIRGRMAYFPDEKTVRFVGHQCAATHYGENFRHAERLFRRQQACRDYFDTWQEIGARREALAQFVARMAKIAADLQFVRDQLDEQAKGYCEFLQRELAQTNGELFIDADLGMKDRTGNAVIQRKSIGRASGLKFLAYGYDVKRDVRHLQTALTDAAQPLPDWSPTTPEHPATDEILKRGRMVARAMRSMLATLASIDDGQRFFARKNLLLLHRWGNRPNTPFARFEISVDGRQVLFRSDSFAGLHYANVVVPEGTHTALPPANDPDVVFIERKVA